MFHLAAVLEVAELLQEHGDQVRRCFQEGFVRIRTEWLEGGEPFFGCAMSVKLALFNFGGRANLFLGLGGGGCPELILLNGLKIGK